MADVKTSSLPRVTANAAGDLFSFTQIGTLATMAITAFALVTGQVYTADESVAQQGIIMVDRTTTSSLDGFNAAHRGTGVGYGVHSIAYGTNGSGIGGACHGEGAGVVGNKRGNGAGTEGNGVYGSAGIDNGDNQTGVYGLFSGSGNGGTGIAAVHSGTGAGNSFFAWRQSSGSGSAGQFLRDGTGDGVAVTITRGGTGTGDALDVTHNSTGGGSAMSVVRQNGSGTPWSLAQLGFYDGTQSIGGYFYAPAGGTVRLAVRADGNIKVTGSAEIGGGMTPAADGGADLGSASLRINTVHAINGVTSTSDRNAKQDIGVITAAELRVGRKLPALVCRWRYISDFDAMGDDAPIRFGVIAQEIQALFESEGLDWKRYAAVTEQRWTDNEGVARTRLGVNYDQLSMLALAAMAAPAA